MARITIADQIECLELILSENADRPIREGVLKAAIRSLKELDYQQIEAKRVARQERKIAIALAQDRAISAGAD